MARWRHGPWCGDNSSQVRYDEHVTENVAELARELPDAELVFAFVSPLGTPTERLQESLTNALRSHGYEVEVVVRISKLLDEMVRAPGGERPAQRQARLMSTGNDLRRSFGGDYLALMAIAAISASRGLGGVGEPRPHRRRAHVIQSLKHPDEVVRLRHVYGKGFFLLGASAPRRVRAEALAMKNFPRDEANALLDKDAAEEERIGQQTRDTFELADAYLRIDELTATGIDAKLMRITDLLFSCPFHVPTQEEHAMFLAYAAALRSGDLSRQVGAVVANRFGDVVASGANDVPSARGSEVGGETVAEQVAAGEGSDYRRGFDSNERERNKILVGVIAALVPEEAELLDATAMKAITPEARATLVKKYKARLEGTGILDLTEFGRAVHAEMAALMSCARSGVTPLGGTLYCTTFPCHNCAKHIVAAGLRSVVYVEPYPKSRAKGLHADAISLPDEDETEPNGPRVQFRAFEGVGPRRFLDLFSLGIGSGRPVRRKRRDADGACLEWTRGADSRPRLALDPRSYLEREDAAAKNFRRLAGKHENLPSDGQRATPAQDPDLPGSS